MRRAGDADGLPGAIKGVLTTVLGAVSCLCLPLLPLDSALWGECVLSLGLGVEAALLCLIASSNSIWVVYVAYALFRALFQVLITLAQ